MFATLRLMHFEVRVAHTGRQRPLERRRVDLLAIATDTVRDAHAQAPGRRLNLAALNDGTGS